MGETVLPWLGLGLTVTGLVSYRVLARYLPLSSSIYSRLGLITLGLIAIAGIFIIMVGLTESSGIHTTTFVVAVINIALLARPIWHLVIERLGQGQDEPGIQGESGGQG